jgi:DNA gyrase subunit B
MSHQAILPLRGKILNVEKASVDSILDHEEIQTIVSAIGTGFLTDEFDESKLRYGKIIVMTDADVDGSHIRTLLLTLFYRKMPELVTRGHVYVAQPPLYKIKKGKVERYAVTEEEKVELLAELGLGTTVLQRLGGRSFQGRDLRELMDSVGKIQGLEKRMPAEGAVPFVDYLHAAAMPDCRLPAYYVVHRHQGRFLDTEVQLDAELARIKKHKGAELAIYEGPESECLREAADVEVYALLLGRELQPLLRKLVGWGIPLESLRASAAPSWEVAAGEERKPAPSLFDAVAIIQKSCEKDLDIQRYKGLGEMNPAQLFESTMDPARRMLKRVSVSDMVEADKIFTVLMGPEVEPRREFIEKHALEATNIDI